MNIRLKLGGKGICTYVHFFPDKNSLFLLCKKIHNKIITTDYLNKKFTHLEVLPLPHKYQTL